MAFNFSFFGSQEHRVFDYKPRYYDKEKEELRQIFGHVDGSNDKKEEKYVPGSYIKGSFRDGNYQKTRVSTTKAQKIIGMVGMLIFFVVIIYFARLFFMLW